MTVKILAGFREISDVVPTRVRKKESVGPNSDTKNYTRGGH
jgi:hypothetical protein